MHRSLMYVATPFVAVAASLALAGPASAHFCTNPDKNEHAPDAGVHYILTGFNENGPILEPLDGAKGQGQGGFVLVEPGVLGNDDYAYTHTGNLVGPGETQPKLACNDHGIDYLFCS